MADTLAELHAMAAQLGIPPRAFQNKASGAHDDVTAELRAQAIALGARAISRHADRELPDFHVQQRAQRQHRVIVAGQRHHAAEAVAASIHAPQRVVVLAQAVEGGGHQLHAVQAFGEVLVVEVATPVQLQVEARRQLVHCRLQRFQVVAFHLETGLPGDGPARASG
ncbi:hypothetical protein G6F22_012829 [Rhizopus arrhizus]|nr:hypothetical protein G6F22_012829 [Rhizopus arrhizus]